MSELINFGSTIKNLGGGKIGGHLVLFGSTNALDLDGEYFAADTNFDIEDGDRRSGYYDHGLDLELGNMKIGTGTLKKDSKGVWLEAQLDTRKAYVEDVLKLVDAGAVGFSSGAVAHLVRKEKSAKGSKITDWPIGEWSITPRPADPRTQVLPLKSWQPESPSLKSLIAIEDKTTTDDKPAAKSENLGETIEEDMTVAALSRLTDALMGQVYSTIYNYWDMPTDSVSADTEADDAMTPTQKVEALRPVFQEFMDKSLSIIGAILSTEPPEDDKPAAGAAGKSVNALLSDLAFTPYLQAMGTVVEEFNRRVAWVHSRRSAAKSGRTFSAESVQAITGYADGIIEHAQNLRALVTPAAEKSSSSTPAKITAAEIDLALLNYQLEWARSLGVPL